MFEVMSAFPTATALMSASPSAVGMVALRGMARSTAVNWTKRSLIDDIVNGIVNSVGTKRVAAEAVTWLETHGLLSALYDTLGSQFIFVTRLGRLILSAGESQAGGIALTLRAVELIPEALRTKIMQPLQSGDFDLAIAAACKAVEVRMRERASLSTSDFGSRLARKFFAKVTKTALQHSERRGDLSDEEHLFAGLFGLYRDRAVHDIPHVDDPLMAFEIITIAGHLLRIVEASELEEASASG